MSGAILKAQGDLIERLRRELSLAENGVQLEIERQTEDIGELKKRMKEHLAVTRDTHRHQLQTIDVTHSFTKKSTRMYSSFTWISAGSAGRRLHDSDQRPLDFGGAVVGRVVQQRVPNAAPAQRVLRRVGTHFGRRWQGILHQSQPDSYIPDRPSSSNSGNCRQLIGRIVECFWKIDFRRWSGPWISWSAIWFWVTRCWTSTVEFWRYARRKEPPSTYASNDRSIGNK